MLAEGLAEGGELKDDIVRLRRAGDRVRALWTGVVIVAQIDQ